MSGNIGESRDEFSSEIVEIFSPSQISGPRMEVRRAGKQTNQGRRGHGGHKGHRGHLGHRGHGQGRQWIKTQEDRSPSDVWRSICRFFSELGEDDEVEVEFDDSAKMFTKDYGEKEKTLGQQNGRERHLA